MGRLAVDLGDDPLLTPQRVDLVAADLDVHFGERDPVSSAEVEHQILKPAQGVCVLRAVELQGSPQLRRAIAPHAARASMALRSSSRRKSASATALRTPSTGATEANSSRVRATGVTGRPRCITRSISLARWTRTPVSDRRWTGLRTWVVSGK